MNLLTFLMQSPDLSEKHVAAQFALNWTPKLVKKGACLFQQGEQSTQELIILDGSAVSRIYDKEGSTVCVGMYVGPCVMTPNIARTRDGLSLVSVETTGDTLVTKMDSGALADLMIKSEPVRNWANGVLSEELNRKAEREWCLAALGGSERLDWFRENYPTYEELFTHSLIASFIGVTPVTFSRLRNNDRNM